MSTFTPREYQRHIINHITSTPRCAVWAGMGMGKTAATLAALQALRILDDRPVLILAPLRVAQTTWPEEIKKWGNFKELKIIAIVGSTKQRKEALNTQADIYTTNYENLPWLIKNSQISYSAIVADESTRLKSYRARQGGIRARALAKIAHQTPRFIQLTGTPSPNGLIDLWGQMWFIDRGQRLGITYTSFKNRWFQPVRVGNHPAAVRHEPTKSAQAEIQNSLRDICITLEAKDWFNIQKPIINHINIELPPSAAVTYREMECDMIIALSQENTISAANAATKTIKCLQIANGAIYNEDGEWVELHNAKIQALESIIEEASGAPILVAYHFKSDLARLSKHFKQGRVLDKNPQTITDWNQGKIPVLFAHPASAGHGLNLQDGGNILVFFSHWWNLEEYQQIIERIGPTRQKQAGHNRPVFIHHIIATGTVDEQIQERRHNKADVQEILLKAMKRRETT